MDDKHDLGKLLPELLWHCFRFFLTSAELVFMFVGLLNLGRTVSPVPMWLGFGVLILNFIAALIEHGGRFDDDR